MKLTRQKALAAISLMMIFIASMDLRLYAQNIIQSGFPSVIATATHNGGDTLVHCLEPVTIKAITNLTATRITGYSVSSIPPTPPFSWNSGRLINVSGDNRWVDTLKLPFGFCFYDSSYRTVVVGTNGILSFKLSNLGNSCSSSYASGLPIPRNQNFPSDALNAIYGVYEDLNFAAGSGGTIRKDVIGAYPNRAACFIYQAPPAGGGSIKNAYMIVLYEGTNIIDVYIKDRTGIGNGLVGIQNDSSGFYGTLATVAPGRQGGSWGAHNEAWRFTPRGSLSYTVTWYQGADTNGRPLFSEVIRNDTAISRRLVTPLEPCDYTARVEYQACNGIYYDLYSPAHINSDTIKREICDTCSDTPIMFGGVMRYKSGVYYDTVKSRINVLCDSIVRKLNLGRISHSWDSVIACGRYVWRDGKTYTRSTILPTMHTTNEVGCDSIIHLHLNMDYRYYDTVVDTICDGQQAFLGNNAYTRTGRYVDTLSSKNGCDSIVMLDLLVIPKPAVVLHNTGFDCEKQTYGLFVQTTDDSTFRWSSVPYDLSLEGQERETLIHVAPTQNTTYFVTAGRGDINPECLVREGILVPVSPRLEARILRTPEYVLSYNTQMKFTDVSRGHVVQRWWTCEKKDAIDTHSYTYYNYPNRLDSTWVKLVVRNEYLCYDSTTMVIRVDYNGGGDSSLIGNRDELWIPNAFSPDLPTNKCFMVKGVGILDFHITIFNRLGHKVYESDNISEKWDGTYNGHMCDPGVYPYVLRYKGQRQPYTEINRKGSVLLVR